MEELGAGLAIDDPSGPPLRERIRRMLDAPSFAEGAERIHQEMLGEPSPNEIVPLLEKLTAEYRAITVQSNRRHICRGI